MGEYIEILKSVAVLYGATVQLIKMFVDFKHQKSNHDSAKVKGC